jgi:glycerate kinase
MKIIVAPNAFKGSLSASDAAFTIAKAAREVYPDAEVVQMPLADGGSGTLDALVESTLGDFIEADCTDALGETLIAPWGMLGADLERPRTGIIELATTCGLKNIPWKKRNPLVTSTFGAGEQVQAALDEMCLDIIFGLGDTGTHDCGAGIAQALGVKLLDKHGNDIPRGGAALLTLHAIDTTKNLLTPRGGKVIAACDVTNLLTGKNSTAKLFAPQKGADADAVKILEDAGAHFLRIVKKELGKDVGALPGCGAAGGVGAGLAAFFNAELRSGADLVMEYTSFNAKALDADVIITGEGKIDSQTSAGKTVAGVCAHAKTLRVPVVAFAGMVDESNDALKKNIGLDAMFCSTPDSATEDDAMRNAREFLYAAVKEKLAAFVSQHIHATHP